MNTKALALTQQEVQISRFVLKWLMFGMCFVVIWGFAMLFGVNIAAPENENWIFYILTLLLLVGLVKLGYRTLSSLCAGVTKKKIQNP